MLVELAGPPAVRGDRSVASRLEVQQNRNRRPVVRVQHLLLVEILPECRTLGRLAHDRLLAGFTDIDGQANRVQAEALASRTTKAPLDPDFPFEAGLDALMAGGDHYIALWNLRQATLNLLATLIYHLFEQHRKRYMRTLTELRRRPVDWKDPQWAKALPSATVVEELRLVANASKHGEGESAAELKQRRPDMFVNPVDALIGAAPREPAARAPFAGDGLFVSGADFAKYQSGVESLWREIAAAHAVRDRPSASPRDTGGHE